MTIKRIGIAEFREFGYLQELNRRFLHPLGLALEVVIEPDGTEHLGGVWDFRDDPEGIRFGEEGPGDWMKYERVEREWANRAEARQAALGYMVQPPTTTNTTSRSE